MIGMLCLIPLFDDITSLRQTTWNPWLCQWILTSCLLALGVNATNYLVLGKTSPLTYQVTINPNPIDGDGFLHTYFHLS